MATATATCDRCGWTKDYAQQQGADVGLMRHRARRCQPFDRAEYMRSGMATQLSRKAHGKGRAREAARWAERVRDAGLSVQRTEAEWVAHPTALDDLLRVLCGASPAAISKERIKEQEARRRSA